MKITKTKLKQIIKEEVVQALNEQTLNEQDEPYERFRPVDEPYTDREAGADKRFAYVLNGRLNKGMDRHMPGFMQKMKSKFGGRDPILDMAMKRLHNVAYEMFYKDIRDLEGEEWDKADAYRRSKQALSAFQDELHNLEDAKILRQNQGIKIPKQQRADIERLLNNWDKTMRDMSKRAGAIAAYNSMTLKALELQDRRKYEEANELIDKIIAGVESGELDNSRRPKNSKGMRILGAFKTDWRGREIKGDDGRPIGK